MNKAIGIICGLAVLCANFCGIRPTAAQSPYPGASAAGGRPYLGAVADDRNERGQGVRVLSVRPGSPADMAGLKPQDLVVGVANTRVRQMPDLTAILGRLSPGDKLGLEVIRGGRPLHVEVTLGQQPPAVSRPIGTPPEPIPAPPSEQPPMLPVPEGPSISPAPGTIPPASDAARIDQLQRRVDQLERRVEELERALAEIRRK